jgi:hypothetical protein
LAGLALLAAVAAGLTEHALARTAGSPPMSIQLVSPHGPVTVKAGGSIPVTVNVQGVVLAPNEIGRNNVDHHGHYHFYLDCIPADAYTEMDLSHCWAGADATTRTVFQLNRMPFKLKKGEHLLIIALAENDHVLYKAPAVVIPIFVR